MTTDLQPVKKTAKEIESDVAHFSGTENYYNYQWLKMTDGVKYLSDACQSYWLIDIVCSLRCDKRIRNEVFISITLIKNKTGRGAKFVADDGNGNILYRQFIAFTDFPLKSIKMYLVDKVLMLTGEY